MNWYPPLLASRQFLNISQRLDMADEAPTPSITALSGVQEDSTGTELTDGTDEQPKEQSSPSCGALIVRYTVRVSAGKAATHGSSSHSLGCRYWHC